MFLVGHHGQDARPVGPFAGVRTQRFGPFERGQRDPSSTSSPSLRRKAALQELMEVFESDSDASQAIMTAASESGQWREVLLLHQRLLRSQTPETPQIGEIYANAAWGLVRAKQWQRALGLISDFRAQSEGLTFWSAASKGPDGSCMPMFQLLLNMCSNFGSWEQVLELLEGLRSCPEAMTTNEVASAMTALTRQKQWRTALRVFAESRDAAGTDKQMYKAAMKAWSCGHSWQQVIGLLAEEQATLGGDQGLDDALGALCEASSSLLKVTGSKARSSSSALAASRLLADMRKRKLPPAARLYNQAGPADQSDVLREF